MAYRNWCQTRCYPNSVQAVYPPAVYRIPTTGSAEGLIVIQTFQLKGTKTKVSAIQVTPDTVEEVTEWCNGVQVEEQDPFDSSNTFVAVNVPGMDRGYRASEGDYVILHFGHFMAVKAPKFERDFEVVNGDTNS